jgi:DNA-binding NarL/FixJ family response regulator
VTTRILLAEDHALVRSGFRTLIEQEPDMTVVGEAIDGRLALEQTARLSPDLVVMDVTMPNLNGVDATQQILHDHPGVRVLALSVHPGRQVVSRMLRAGASGYLVKTCAAEELVRAIRSVMSGKTYLSPEISSALVDAVREPVPDNNSRSVDVLSRREREVLQLVAEGNTTKAIAAALHVTVKTIEGHRHAIMAKLDLHSIAELTKFAVREGLTSLTL